MKKWTRSPAIRIVRQKDNFVEYGLTAEPVVGEIYMRSIHMHEDADPDELLDAVAIKFAAMAAEYRNRSTP